VDHSAGVLLLWVHAAVMGLCAAVGGLMTAAWTAGLLYALVDTTAPPVVEWFFAGVVALRAMLLVPTIAAVAMTGAAATSLRRGGRRFVLATIVAAIVVPIANMLTTLMTFDPLGFAWLFSLAVGLGMSVVVTVTLPHTEGRDDEW